MPASCVLRQEVLGTDAAIPKPNFLAYPTRHARTARIPSAKSIRVHNLRTGTAPAIFRIHR